MTLEPIASEFAVVERGLLVTGTRTELILVRHAQQRRSHDENSRPAGPRLSELGVVQARLTGEFLAQESTNGEVIDAVYCSDLDRARQTAEIIANLTTSAEPLIDRELREVEVYGSDPELSTSQRVSACQEFARTLQWHAFPGGESGAQVRGRMHAALERIATKHRDHRVVVVSHSGSICAVIAEMIGARRDMFYFAGHASVNRIFHGDNRFITHSLNEVAHLRARGVLTY